MEETNAPRFALEVGCLTLAAAPAGSAGPAGTTHFVEGWEPLCGSGRVRFIFPGRGDELGANCPDCVQAVAVPRQRTAAKRPAGTTRTRRAS